MTSGYGKSRMTIYKDVQLKALLEQAGFRDIQVHKNNRGWLCVMAVKPAGNGE